MKWSIEAVLLVTAAAMEFFGNSIVERDLSNGPWRVGRRVSLSYLQSDPENLANIALGTDI
ncbi:hypothetical protein LMANV2_240137 [Leptospira interrogans serovar Manilae]|uniref:Uncharacterized protein n=1 Tax=Leptospira interrogans serovar Manilae TaxID=214675 RepID=A0AAQ1NWC9_LEPIR|nr:hypothetical protein LIMLP_03245 [Leptospira interrogans serovar Manilae]AKP28844.1 hypothetical protein LIMHP_03230 [Leptospira interrogans serovar Manilae]EYU64547.1 hypothetical protein CI00_06690 [Leptospira interrogans serovar Manilae]SOR61085.1 hypothetical protein LMANV2_240137 [Leptospira interrogans serovar Manilae]